jgi:hypothetical protein
MAGRPALDPHDPSSKVTLTLPSRQLDEYCRQALREDVSVPEVIRRELAKKPKNTD